MFYAIKNVIYVKTGLDWRNLRFKMERIRKKGKQHDSSMISTRAQRVHESGIVHVLFSF